MMLTERGILSKTMLVVIYAKILHHSLINFSEIFQIHE